MNTLLNDRAFMAQFEKSKLEAKQKARQDSDLMVEGIYARMFVDLSGWVDTNKQVQQQQREEEEELQLQALPFIIETDGSTELGAQIAAATAATNTKLNSQVGRPALQNESLLINQQDNAPIPPPVVKEEFATSVTVIKNFANIKNDNIGNSNITKNNIIITKKFYGRRNQINNNTNNFRINKKNSNIIISNINTTANINNSVINTNNKNNETRNVINRNINNHNQTSTSICIANDNDTEMNCGCVECLLKEEEQSINKAGDFKVSLEEGSKEDDEIVDALKQYEVEARLFDCPKCDLRFISDCDLKVHSTVHSNNLSLECGLCKKQFGDMHSFEAHLMSRCHKKQAHMFTCEICSKQFNRSSSYDRHLASVHSSGHNCNKYSCRFCERKFYYDNIRVKHENAVHHKIRPFRCTWEGCQFGSACRENVVSHVGSIHFGVPQKEQRKMRKNGGLLDFGKYVRKVIPSGATRKQAKK